MFSTPSHPSRRRRSIRWLLSGLAVCYTLAAATAFGATPDGVITTIAGTGTAGVGGDGGSGTTAQVSSPLSVTVDAAGNVYIADTNNARIRKVAAGTGVITTFAGTGVAGFLGDGGAATAARLYLPSAVAIGPDGHLYIADRYNQRIRKVDIGTGIITTVAGSGSATYGGDGGVATAAQLNYPYGVSFDSSGNMYIADTNNHRVRKVAVGSAIITTIAGTGTPGYNGDGQATSANLYNPQGVAADSAGNVYISDTSNDRIRKVTAATGVISTVAGTGSGGFSGENGPGTSARVNAPVGMVTDAAGNVYFADYYNLRIRKLTVATGIVTTVVGSGTLGYQGDGGLATAAALYYPTAVARDSAGALYIADSNNHRVRKVAPPTVATLTLSTLAGTGTPGYNGDGPATSANVYNPQGVAVDSVGNVYIADTSNNRIRKITPGTGVISTVAGTGVGGFTGEGGPATGARVNAPVGMAVDAAGNFYFADYYNQRIRKVTVATGIISTVAGSGVAGFLGDGGVATAAQLSYPTGVAVDTAGNLYIADSSNHRIRKVTAATSIITTIAGTGTPGVGGDGGPGTSAQLYEPHGVAVDSAGNVYIADTQNARVRRVAAGTGIITTYAGSGVAGYDGEARLATMARLYVPTSVAVDSAGNVYVADRYNHRVRKVALGTGIITTVVGDANAGYGGDGGVASAGQLNYPYGVAVDAAGSVYVADTNNHRVRKASVPATSMTLRVVRQGQTAVPYWTPVPGATAYVLYRGTLSGGWVLLANNVASTLFVDTTVAPNTTYSYLVATYPFGVESVSNFATFRLTSGSSAGDFDGDGRADVTVFRPALGMWYSLRSGTNYASYTGHNWGVSTDIPLPRDYDGDGKTDIAVYRPSIGTWFVLRSSTNFTSYGTYQWGVSTDIPVPADYDGDGKADLAVYRPSVGTWYVLRSSTNYTTWGIYQWGNSSDVPVPADYDGDGQAEIAIFRPSTGAWYILRSLSGYTSYTSHQWGGGTDVPVVGDYDGDGRADIAVYRPSGAAWYILQSNLEFTTYATYQWGSPTDVPVPNDYDGDGMTDLGVFRPSTSAWYVLRSSTNFTNYSSYIFGVSTDTPLPTRP